MIINFFLEIKNHKVNLVLVSHSGTLILNLVLVFGFENVGCD
jgi:hypothetical protein